MAEWSIAAVLKTVELRGSGGSNPSLSAIKKSNSAMSYSFFYCTKFATFVILILILKTLNRKF